MKDIPSFFCRGSITFMYSIGDRIFHPMHGAGMIDDIVSQRIAGQVREYYVFRAAVGRVVVMLPRDGCDNIGVRPLSDAETARAVLDTFPSLEVSFSANWNQRHRENMERLKTGNLCEIARVVKGLILRDHDRSLSSMERRLLTSARQILLSELSLALDCGMDELEHTLYKSLFPDMKG